MCGEMPPNDSTITGTTALGVERVVVHALPNHRTDTGSMVERLVAARSTTLLAAENLDSVILFRVPKGVLVADVSDAATVLR